MDIIEIDRIAAAATNPRFLERVYTDAERTRCIGRRNPAEELAGRFASKEAVIKCLGRRVPWKSIEVLNEPSGKPYVTLHGIAETLAGGRRIALSISHSRSYAVASAVMEGEAATQGGKKRGSKQKQRKKTKKGLTD